jgi:rhodanese-related sulfurtransferase
MRSTHASILLSLFLVPLGAACNPGPPSVRSGDDTAAAEVAEAPTADPDLFAEGKFAAAADIKAADDAGEDIVFVDSRVALDYEAGHIPGAVHVPYFEAADHLDELPQDRWIVTYCECPHAEAEQVADVLLDNGYTMVRVMDEGLQGWRDADGAVEGGTPPPPQG